MPILPNSRSLTNIARHAVRGRNYKYPAPTTTSTSLRLNNFPITISRSLACPASNMSLDPVYNLPNPGPLTEAQRGLIKATVPLLEQSGVDITRCFYKAMLGANPDLKNVFSHTKQVKGDQPEALARSVYAYAANIDDLTPVLPVVERLCHKHASLNILPQQYTIVGKHLLEAITEIVGKDVFKGDLYDAWFAAYWQLAHICINREAELYKAAAWVGWRDFIVRDKVHETDEITSFYLVPKDGGALPSYKPGQYISVQRFVDSLGFNQSRQYSLSDAPNADHIRISVRRENGGPNQEHPGCISNLLHDGLKQGDTVEVAFPFGDFFLDESTSPVVLISAGVGLTPLTSMLHSIVASPSPREVSWVQVVHSQDKHALNEEVRNLLKQHPTPVRKTIFYSEPGSAVKGEHFDIEGRMDLSKVDDLTLRLGESAQYYVCGPEQFMADMGKALLAKGVEHSRIHAEVFGAADVPI